MNNKNVSFRRELKHVEKEFSRRLINQGRVDALIATRADLLDLGIRVSPGLELRFLYDVLHRTAIRNATLRRLTNAAKRRKQYVHGGSLIQACESRTPLNAVLFVK